MTGFRFVYCFIVSCSVALILAGCATPPQQTLKLWNASAIANTSAEMALLRGGNGQPIGQGIRVADVQRMIQIKERVEGAAGQLRTGFFLAEGDEPNGYSFSSAHGPVVAINLGMINLISGDDDAFAALIGHELAHLYLRHGDTRRNREEKRVATSVALSFVFGLVGAPLPFDATDAATSAMSSQFSREEEREADRLGLQYIMQAGFEPMGAVRLQEKLGAAVKGLTFTFFSSHPPSNERIEYMKKMVVELRTKQLIREKK